MNDEHELPLVIIDGTDQAPQNVLNRLGIFNKRQFIVIALMILYIYSIALCYLTIGDTENIEAVKYAICFLLLDASITIWFITSFELKRNLSDLRSIFTNAKDPYGAILDDTINCPFPFSFLLHFKPFLSFLEILKKLNTLSNLIIRFENKYRRSEKTLLLLIKFIYTISYYGVNIFMFRCSTIIHLYNIGNEKTIIHKFASVSIYALIALIVFLNYLSGFYCFSIMYFYYRLARDNELISGSKKKKKAKYVREMRLLLSIYKDTRNTYFSVALCISLFISIGCFLNSNLIGTIIHNESVIDKKKNPLNLLFNYHATATVVEASSPTTDKYRLALLLLTMLICVVSFLAVQSIPKHYLKRLQRNILINEKTVDSTYTKLWSSNLLEDFNILTWASPVLTVVALLVEIIW